MGEAAARPVGDAREMMAKVSEGPPRPAGG